jgi:hypothetical protein
MNQDEFEPGAWLKRGLWALVQTIERGARPKELRLPVVVWAVALAFLWGVHTLWALCQISGFVETLFILTCLAAEVFGAAWLGNIMNLPGIAGRTDPEIEQWVRQMMACGTIQIVHDFEALNAPRKFAIEFGFRIAGGAPDHLEMVNVRLEAKKTPEEEIKLVQNRIVQIIQPLVSDLPPTVLVMNHRDLWLQFEKQLNLYASPILAEEFGLRVAITDLFRGKNSLERTLDGFEDAPLIKRLDELSALVDQSFTRWAAEISSAGFNVDDPDASKVRQTVENLEKAVRTLKKEINERQHVDVRESPSADTAALKLIAAESLERMQHSIDARKKLLLHNPPRNST